jgi:hypothetical protein
MLTALGDSVDRTNSVNYRILFREILIVIRQINISQGIQEDSKQGFCLGLDAIRQVLTI